MTSSHSNSLPAARTVPLALVFVAGAASVLGILLALGWTGGHTSVVSHLFAITVGATAALVLSVLRRPRRSVRSTAMDSVMSTVMDVAPTTTGLFSHDTLERMRLAVQAAGIGVFEWDIVGQKLIVDHDRLGAYGDNARAAIVDPVAFIKLMVHPDDFEQYVQDLTLAVKEKTHFLMSYRMLHADGTARHMQLHGQVLRDAAGEALHVLGIVFDKTPQVEATQRLEQQALEQQHAMERLDLATRAAGIGIWDMDLVTNKLVGDTNMTRLWEQRDTTQFPSLVDFLRKAVHPEDLLAFEKALYRTMKHGTSVEHRYREVQPDGSIHHIQFHGKMFRDSTGAPVRFLAVTVNVSAQMQAQQALQEHAKEQAVLLERLDLATRVGGIGVWDLDIATDSMMVDASIARAYGMKGNKIERNARAFCTSAVFPDDVEEFKTVIERGLGSGQSFSHRHRIVLPTGELKHAQFHAHVFRDDAGAPTRVLGVTIDVTAEVARAEQLRMQAAEERALRDRLNLATQTAGIGVWDMDIATRKITSDAYTREIMGVESEIDEAALTRTIHPDDAPAVWGSINAALRDREHSGLVSMRHRLMRRDGQSCHVQTHIRVFRDAQAKPLRILGVTWDVTAEVEHAQELQAQAAHVQTLLERIRVASTAAGISAWELDLRKNEFTWFENRTKVFGLDHVPLEGYRAEVRKLIHPDDLKEIDPINREALRSGQQTFSYRFRIVRPGGTVRHLQSHVHIVRNELGRGVRMLGATSDITNEVQTTQLLQQKAEQERVLNDRLAIATEAAGIGTWEIDLERQRFLWVENPIKGHEEALRNNPTLSEYAKLVHPEDRDILPNALSEAFRTGSTRLSYRHRSISNPERILHIQSHAYLVPNDEGRMVRLLGASWEITKEIEAAQKLDEQARHQRLLLDRLGMATEAAGICSWEIDLESRRFLWTDNWLKALGDTKPEDAQSTDLFVALRLHPDDRDVFENAIADALRAKSDRFSRRYRAIGKDGNVVHVTSHARLIFNERGRVHRMLGMSWDITREVQDTKLLEEQSQQQAVLLERLKLSSEAAGICSFEVDMERGVFLWSENPIKAITDMDLRGVPIDDFANLAMIPEDRHIFRDTARQALKEGRNSYSFRYRGQGRDGQRVHVETHAHFVLDAKSGRAVRLLGVSWDITKNVEAAEQLERQSVAQRQLFERLTIATQVADISSWELDLRKPEFLWLENPIKGLLYPGDTELTVERLQQRVHPEDRDLLLKQILIARKTGADRVSYRYRSYAKDGTLVHIQNYVKLSFNERGHAVNALGASWDVTKEIQAAERLEQQAEQLSVAERRLERASLSSSEGHWESDIVNQRVWFSSSSHALLGYKEGGLPSQFGKLDVLFHAEDLQTHHETMQRHLEQGVPYLTDSRVLCGNGEYRWFRVRGTAERDANGEPISISGSIHDIHEQKLIENALQLAQRRFERAINGTQDGLWELESNGTAWSSPRIGELLGYSPEEFPSSTNFLREHLHADDDAAVASATEAHFQQNQPYDIEIRLLTKSGEYRWYRARAKAERDAIGRPLRMSGSLQDVTEARTAREELTRAREVAEAASSAKSSFLANVSHEIRTPMNGIIGMTGLLLDTALDRTQRDYAQTIRGSADSLLIVINDILDFSKIEAGKLEIEALELDLRGNVEDVGAMMAFQAAAKNLELVVHVHPDIPDRVIGDPQRIRQCLINLVGNAVKFTRQGEIVIEVSTVARRDGKVLAQFQVRDTGIGVAPETLKTLFQPFVQADASTTRHFGGTGLGLSIVRRLVEMMDGAVGVESELGKGSTFWFTLPLEPTANAPESRQSDVNRRGQRVLIVDDNETNRRVLAGQLMHAGYEVSLAQSGSEALQMMRQGLGDNHPYDIVLADYHMEDMDGAALGERINADPHLSRARIVILTSLDRHGDIRRFASLGFAGYLTKPVRARELFECLDRVLARESKEWHLQSQPMVTRGTLVSDEGARRYEGHVLLVEDNPVNQKVAVRFLERMGCQVRVADNGAEGVKAYQESRFDLVLMDLQMPVMDGLTATRRIRELEIELGHTTPIVALTANAMAGQLERCMDAGMNGFLTKPLEIERLHETLEHHGLTAVPSADKHASISGQASTPINLARLNEITDGDPDFAFELASTFISSGEQVLEEIQLALDAFDRTGLSRAAHKLKGASANIHAETLRELAYALETQAGSVDQPRLKELVTRLREGFEIAAEFLREQAPPPAPEAVSG